ncbi:MAG: hypothetical protein BWY20_02269 [Spirochaetes bacterium ADurb.Bin215]|nr:MAG: hypothetical protein BWY20_02269 [Spirochaetes bacterium ADurb.Bin215]
MLCLRAFHIHNKIDDYYDKHNKKNRTDNKRNQEEDPGGLSRGFACLPEGTIKSILLGFRKFFTDFFLLFPITLFRFLTRLFHFQLKLQGIVKHGIVRRISSVITGRCRSVNIGTPGNILCFLSIDYLYKTVDTFC